MKCILNAAMSLLVTLALGVGEIRAIGADKNASVVNSAVRSQVPSVARSDTRRKEADGTMVKAASNASESYTSDSPRAEKVADGSRMLSDDSLSSGVPLPNTMNGLNDKRPLSIGDKLSFKVVEDEGSPRPVFVTDSGEIDVPYIGRVSVGTKTCKQFAYYVKRLLEKEYYYQATVIIGLDSAGGQTKLSSRGKVYVMGQVRSSGPQEIPAEESYTVSKAIMRAGGFGPYADKKKVRLVRAGKTGMGSKPLIINCFDILEKGNRELDVEVAPEDIITVPEKWINIFN